MPEGNSQIMFRLLGGAGILLLGLGLLADLFSIGAPGFGIRQFGMVAVGIALLVVANPRGRAGIVDGLANMPKATTGETLFLGMWFGLITGFVEMGHQALRKYALDIVVARPADLIWVAPTLYALTFTAIAIVLAPVHKLLPRILTIPVQVFLWVLLMVWLQCLLHPTLNEVAMLAISAGLAFQAARTAARHRKAFVWMLKRTAFIMAAVVAVLAALTTLTRLSDESSTIAQLPPARQGAPNVLLVVLDTVRADHLGAYGYTRDTTPTMDRLAANGTVFDAAISTSPWTLPSHASMFTGRYHHETSADWLKPLDDRYPTLAEKMNENGYITAGFVGNLNYCSSAHGIARGFSRFEDFPLNRRMMTFCTVLGEYLFSSSGLSFINMIRNNAEHITDRFLNWIDGHDVEPDIGKRPFFGFLNYFDAHGLYLTQPDFQNRYAPVPDEFVKNWYGQREWGPEEMAKFVAAYDGCLAFIDHHFARLIDGLEERGMLDNTIVIITADHGEQFGEHGLKDHSNSLYRPLIHSPLILHFPAKIAAGKRIPDFVSLRDLPATILDLVEAKDAAEQMPGRSLSRFWSDDPSAREYDGTPVISEVTKGIRRPDWEPISKGDMKSLFENGMHFILNGDDTWELYDFAADPAEENNLAQVPEHAETAQQMRETIRRVTGK